MRSLIDVASIASTIYMLREDYKQPVIVVEGPTDELFLREFVDINTCSIYSAGGYEIVKYVIDDANKRGINKLLGIIDGDFRRIDQEETNENIILTDYHDIEIMMFCSGAFEKLIRVIGDTNRTKLIQDIRQPYYHAASVIGAFRLFNYRAKTGLLFEDIDYSKFVDKKLIIDKGAMAKYIINRTCSKKGIRPPVSDEDAIDGIDHILYEKHNKNELCNGHDILHLISLSLQRLVAKYNANDFLEDDIFKCLLLAYNKGYFSQTLLHNQLATWFDQNNVQWIA